MAGMLLPVMEEMLVEETFTEISVERLVSGARDKGESISRSSFYNHFDDKSALLELMVENVMAELFETASGWWDLDAIIDEDRLLRALKPIADGYLPHSAVIRSVVEASSYDRRLAEVWSGLMARAAAFVEAHLVEGQAQGFVSPEVEPRRDAEWITWMIERGLQQLVATSTGDQRDRYLMAARDIMWRALYDTEL